MGDILRIVLAILLPPLAVIDKGLGAILVVTILWFLGWLPGVIAALFLGFFLEPRRVYRY